MAYKAALNDNPFEAPEFLEGLEAAGYLQRLDTSEARITARYQHALTKMRFAAHSEEFLTRAGVRKVHGSTVQFFNETPVSDPFVHVMVGSLPPSKQALVTPVGCPTSGWTPINSPDEADGTVHFTVSHAGFWPLTVVFDSNPQDMGRENDPRWKSAEPDSGSDSEADFYNSVGRSNRRSSTSNRRGAAGASTSYSMGAAGLSGRSGRNARAENAASYGAGSGAGAYGSGAGAGAYGAGAGDSDSQSSGDDAAGGYGGYGGNQGGGYGGNATGRSAGASGSQRARSRTGSMSAMSAGAAGRRSSSRAGSRY